MLSSYIYYSVGADGWVEILSTLLHSRQLHIDDIQLEGSQRLEYIIIHIVMFQLTSVGYKYASVLTNTKQESWLGK